MKGSNMETKDDDLAAYQRDGFVKPNRRLPAGELGSPKEFLEEVRSDKGKKSVGGDFHFDLHVQFEPMAPFCTGPVFRELCRRFIGEVSYLCWSQLVAKIPGRSGVFPWHQDRHYALGAGETRASIQGESLTDQLVCWIARADATAENGALTAAPGWHQRGLLPHQWSEVDQARHCQFEPGDTRLMEMKAGELILFSRFTPYKSGPNRTGKIRLDLQLAFRSRIRKSKKARAIPMALSPQGLPI